MGADGFTGLCETRLNSRPAESGPRESVEWNDYFKFAQVSGIRNYVRFRDLPFLDRATDGDTRPPMRAFRSNDG